MGTLYLIGRLIFGAYFLFNAYQHLAHHKNMTAYAKMKRLPMAGFFVFFSGLLLLAGGTSVFLNIRMILGMWLLVIFMVPTTFIMHAFWGEKDPGARMNERIAFLKNMAIIGALLMMIALGYM